MKSTVLLVLYALIALAAAWSKEDYEIFRLRDEVVLSEGPDVTFYDFLGVKPSASQIELQKALKKRSRTLHPDKIKQQFIAARSTIKPKQKGDKKSPGVHVSKGPSEKEVKNAYKEATERYARLGVVAKILQGENRERYDYFLANGFPKWRGTGYYYARFRPGLGSVLVGLFLVLGGGAHYGALVVGWKRQRDFIDRYIRQARRTAWGDETGIRGIPGVDSTSAPVPATTEEPESMMQMNRRQKRQLEKENKKDKSGKGKTASKPSGMQTPNREAGPTGEKKRVVADNGKILIVDAVGNVYLEEEDEDGNNQEFLLDPNEIPKPTLKDTALFKFPAWTYHKITSRIRKPAQTSEEDDSPALEVSDPSQEQDQDPGSSFEVIGNDSPVDAMAQANASSRKRNRKNKS
ncbi:hypothetical protein EPUS_04873 [Endocarpon pusillum Z07020]|uniref:J domain-containing protein n=1 Tax=Endocarpon pusillum (strain Z07020 / HMAS-L-300199) TaxID=1263415 RepID=U1GSW6_ENDPU|nr:uncharacterized protein EPUS_04873 [Endocarpon pusillum Z07020]ERF75091.1 hypothetical protein EPUS_04873 [Endocarpon pusillum Z07020]